METTLNEIYETSQILLDISKSIFIALPKKPGVIECELHRMINVMSHRNSRGTVWLFRGEMYEEYYLHPPNYNYSSSRNTKKRYT